MIRERRSHALMDLGNSAVLCSEMWCGMWKLEAGEDRDAQTLQKWCWSVVCDYVGAELPRPRSACGRKLDVRCSPTSSEIFTLRCLWRRWRRHCENTALLSAGCVAQRIMSWDIVSRFFCANDGEFEALDPALCDMQSGCSKHVRNKALAQKMVSISQDCNF